MVRRIVFILLGLLFFVLAIPTVFMTGVKAETPFEPRVSQRFRALESGVGLVDGAITGGKIASGTITHGNALSPTATGTSFQRMLKFMFNNTFTTTGTFTLPHSLPAGTIIKQSFIRIVTAFTATTTSTLALGCATTGDILAATGITAFATNLITSGVQTGGASAMSLITSTCSLKATVGTLSNTGVLHGFLELAN